VRIRSQDDHGRSLGMPVGIVILKIKLESFLWLAKPMSTVALELGPCPSRHPHAVGLGPFRRFDTILTTGLPERLPVEVATLDDEVLREHRREMAEEQREGRCPITWLGPMREVAR
jgi:hypothetical protein